MWSIHPKYLDARGLVALWREGLLAQKVLRGETQGYRYHPQLNRFKEAEDPKAAIAGYLKEVVKEAGRRGYCFDET
ncbi:MAG TPA: pyrimidine dimer DNA glycosylase/endonuclease V, partial [Methanotrichaceae archaeon]|nr:pyrimidine dimer DNA glycosylase/endonuclease V [Methanotrichaceae archaeon]